MLHGERPQMRQIYGTMQTMRGNETLIIDADEEIVCTCHSDNHRELARDICRYLNQTENPPTPNLVGVFWLGILALVMVAFALACTLPLRLGN